MVLPPERACVMIYVIYVALSVFLAGCIVILGLKLQSRRKRVLAAVYSNFHIPKNPEPLGDSGDNGECCILTESNWTDRVDHVK